MNALRFVLCFALSVALALPAEARAFFSSPAVKLHEPEDAFGIVFQFGTTSNAYRNSGEQYDTDLCLYYLRARYLNPDSGRFWSMDSYEGAPSDPATLHKYLYANANPVMFGDPSGYQSILIASLTNFAIKTLAYIAVVAPPVAAGARALQRIDMARAEQFLRTVQVSAIQGASRVSALTAQANRLYPKAKGLLQEHHFVTQQLVKRLAEKGIVVPPNLAKATVELPKAYHQLITNRIRESFGHGSKVFDKVRPTLDDVLRELEKIYDDLPLL